MAGLRDRREAGVEAARDLAAAGVEALEPLELLEADRRIELGRPHVEAGGDEQKARIDIRMAGRDFRAL